MSYPVHELEGRVISMAVVPLKNGIPQPPRGSACTAGIFFSVRVFRKEDRAEKRMDVFSQLFASFVIQEMAICGAFGAGGHGGMSGSCLESVLSSLKVLTC